MGNPSTTLAALAISPGIPSKMLVIEPPRPETPTRAQRIGIPICGSKPNIKGKIRIHITPPLIAGIMPRIIATMLVRKITRNTVGLRTTPTA
jgi:hypothetical protein